jgi:hypothetical protein
LAIQARELKLNKQINKKKPRFPTKKHNSIVNKNDTESEHQTHKTLTQTHTRKSLAKTKQLFPKKKLPVANVEQNGHSKNELKLTLNWIGDCSFLGKMT